FMVTSLLTGFLPWSVFLPGAFLDFIADCKDRFSSTQSRQRLFLWVWTAVVTGFFSFSRGKCDYYVLPVYPAVSLLVAWHIVSGRPRRLMMLSALIFLAAGLASPLLLSVISLHAGFEQWWILPVCLVVCGSGALAAAIKDRLAVSVAMLFAAVC